MRTVDVPSQAIHLPDVQLEWLEKGLAAASFPAVVPVHHPADGMQPDGNRLEMISGIPYIAPQSLTESLDDGLIRELVPHCGRAYRTGGKWSWCNGKRRVRPGLHHGRADSSAQPTTAAGYPQGGGQAGDVHWRVRR